MIRGCVQWVPRPDKERMFVGLTSGRHAVVFDEGEAGAGPTPMEAVALALAGCTAFDVINILRKKHQDVTGYEVRVEGDRQVGPPAVFAALRVHHVVRGRGVSQEAVRQAIDLSHGKYCSVGAMLSATVPIEMTFEVLEETAGDLAELRLPLRAAS